MADNNNRRITGYALKFDVKSRILQEGGKTFVEVLKRGCITKSMLDKQDFVLTLYHDPSKVLARSNQGSGSLHYEVDSIGVKYWADMPHTQWGDEALELVRRGDVDGCSFIYSTDEEKNVTWVRGKDVPQIRYVNKIDHVYDFTMTYRPAYQDTEVAQRQLRSINLRSGNNRGAMNFSGTVSRQGTQSSQSLRERQRLTILARIKEHEKSMRNYKF